MGAESSKDNKRVDLLSAEEYQHLHKLHRTITKEDMKSWEVQLDPYLFTLIKQYLCKDSSKQDFNIFMKLFTHLIRGSIEEKTTKLLELLSKEKSNKISYTSVMEYFRSVISSYIIMECNRKDREYKSWKSVSCPLVEREYQELTESQCRNLLHKDNQVSYEDLQTWLMTCTQLTVIQSSVFYRLYNLRNTSLTRGVEGGSESLLPMCKGVPTGSAYPSILNLMQVLSINLFLPSDLNIEWRLLFSTKVHGESFSKMLGQIVEKGATIIIIQDEGGHVFGGFAPESWKPSPNYRGNEKCFLFSLFPTISSYDTTYYNDHYQYLNINQQTMPNGLGMGGQFGYFGLWLDAEFGKGHTSETCTTFRNFSMMSSTKEFHIKHLEVWAVGLPNETESSTVGCSILDADKSAQAILDLVGRPQHSQGLREPES